MDPPYADLDIENIDIHGKISHLDAIDMSQLTLAKRYALITLSGPWISDDYGRFTTSLGALPLLPALTHRKCEAALRALEEDGLLKTWTIGGTKCWEVAGAYAFKPGLKEAKQQRKRMAVRLQKEKEKRNKAKKDGTPYVPSRTRNSKGSGVMIRTGGGKLAPLRQGLWYRSSVPLPKGLHRDRMIVKQPDDPENCNLRLLPSFNPAEGLTALGAVIRHYLLMESDDYGRVRLDVHQLHNQLGREITKRGVGLETIEAELSAMAKAGYLKVVQKPRGGRFAFIRDSAQHMMTRKRSKPGIPKLMDDREFTYDSEAYLAFYKRCDEHSISNDLVYVETVKEGGKELYVFKYVKVAARQFVEEHDKLMAQAPYSQMTPAQFCGLESWQGSPLHFSTLDQFLHAVRKNLPLAQMLELYLTYRDELDGSCSGHKNTHKILKHLLKMTPRACMEDLVRAHNEESLRRYPERSQSVIMHGQVPVASSVSGLATGSLDAMCHDLANAERIVAEMAWAHTYQIDRVRPSTLPRRLFLHRPGGNVWEINIADIQDRALLGSRLRALLYCKTIIAHEAKPVLRWLQANFGFVPASVCCTHIAARLLAKVTGREGDSVDACLQHFYEAGPAPHLGNPGDAPLRNNSSKVEEILKLYMALCVDIVANPQAAAQGLRQAWDLENSVLPALAAIEANGIHIDRQVVEQSSARGEQAAGLLLTRINPTTGRLHVAIDPDDDNSEAETLSHPLVEIIRSGPMRAALSAPAGRRLVVAGYSNAAALIPHAGGSASDGMKSAMALSQTKLPESARLVLKIRGELFVECPADNAEEVRTILVGCLTEGMTQIFPGIHIGVEARIWKNCGVE